MSQAEALLDTPDELMILDLEFEASPFERAQGLAAFLIDAPEDFELELASLDDVMTAKQAAQIIHSSFTKSSWRARESSQMADVKELSASSFAIPAIELLNKAIIKYHQNGKSEEAVESYSTRLHESKGGPHKSRARLPLPVELEEKALCKGVDPSLFYPRPGESSDEAKQVCAECPVREMCLEHALSTNEKFGVWGGLNNRERERILKARRNASKKSLEA